MDAKDNRFYREPGLHQRVFDEMERCKYDGADDIASLLLEVCVELSKPQPSVSMLDAIGWLTHRGSILAAIDEKGYVILSDKTGFRMELKK